ncbi:hypothetical protein OGAPHI_004171 [Ogataea philodendri]|uniref:Low affinity vacuolar monovalent cation/H(+) antiporter n=1 Tax=Ogataea philodendri TaxID=1378263 RepID=A0A9P8P715_9ASCO|nr:uncharacterized protein OGAPHI_004171 [Ogataea philodendri]KAH3665982.1 hypothetical protein OGAPHI_004171 [Ogataea philodendri]
MSDSESIKRTNSYPADKNGGSPTPISPTPSTQSGTSQGPKPQRSSRALRSTPLPASHALMNHQHLTGSASHHRQYILLRDKGNNTNSPVIGGSSVASSPQVGAASQKGLNVIQGKPRPFLRKAPSSKYIFSVDDDEDEVEEDLNREYLEGYTDALRHRFKKSLATSTGSLDQADAKTRKIHELETEIAQNLISTAKDISTLREREGDSVHLDHDENAEPLNEEDNAIKPRTSVHELSERDNDNSDAESTSSSESFTLRGRQDAINETHPFGIRIWKPAIYKKNRSVEIEAENDIHSTPQVAREVSPSIAFCNFIWSCTFGLALFFVCLFTGIITLFFTMFSNPRKSDSIRYAKLYLNFSTYLLNPFGKIMLLREDKNYLTEDANVGSTLAEFARWRTQDEGRLFYAAPSRKRPANENTPLQENGETQYGSEDSTPKTDDQEDSDEDVYFSKQRLFGRGKWNIGRIIFFALFYLIAQPVMLLMGAILWLLVFTIPMAKVLFTVCSHIRRHPLAICVEVEKDYYQKRLSSNTSHESILICTYRSLGFHYYKYTVDGTNIFFINLIFLVFFTIFDFFVLHEYFGLETLIVDPILIFVLCLVSIIPLAYFIGQAVASISAQTSMGLGAVINAFFSTIVEVFLYCMALNQSKGKLVEGSMIGSVLGAVLLLPGTSMCGGAFRRKTQRYNPASAGVSSTMLLYAIFVMLSPTILYEIYGQYEVRCFDCEETVDLATGNDCKRCHFLQPNLAVDRLYLDYLRPFTLICAVGLFFAYCIGLLFTLKTHAALIWSTPVVSEKEKKTDLASNTENNSVKSLRLDNTAGQKRGPTSTPKLSGSKQNNAQTTPTQVVAQQPSSGGHDAPNWSRTKSTTILLLATLLYAVIAEILVDVVDDVLSAYPINPKFLGLTVFALVPNTTEFVNAFSFATHGNVALSMEIGSAYALQVCLLQIPIVTLYSLIQNVGAAPEDINRLFSLIFPRWDCIAALISVYMFTYVYAEGKSNYFKGSILILVYISVIAGFYFSLVIDSNGLHLEKLRLFFNLSQKVKVGDLVQNIQSNSGSQWVSTVSCTVISHIESFLNSLGDHSGSDWESVSKSLGHGHDIWMSRFWELGVSPETAGSAQPTLDLVVDQNDLVLVTEFSQLGHKFSVHREDSTFSLNRLNYNTTGFVRNDLLHRLDIVWLGNLDTWNKRSERLLVFWVWRHRKGSHSSAMERVLKSDKLNLIIRNRLSVLSSKFQGSLVGLST